MVRPPFYRFHFWCDQTFAPPRKVPDQFLKFGKQALRGATCLLDGASALAKNR